MRELEDHQLTAGHEQRVIERSAASLSVTLRASAEADRHVNGSPRGTVGIRRSRSNSGGCRRAAIGHQSRPSASIAALMSVSTTSPFAPTCFAMPADKSPVPPRDIERALTRSQPRLRQRGASHTVDAARHQVVHQVVVPATDSNTARTRAAFSPTGTSWKPKSVVSAGLSAFVLVGGRDCICRGGAGPIKKASADTPWAGSPNAAKRTDAQAPLQRAGS